MIRIATDRPLQDAVEQFAQRAPLGSTLSSAEWELVPAEIRMRAMFSSRVECERLLAEFQARIQQRLQLEKSTLPGGGEGVTMDRARFVGEMRDELEKTGYRPDPKQAGTLRDLTSQSRLGVIWKMNIDQARGYAQWKSAMDPDLLAASPAWEFVRLEARMEIRQWPAVWSAHGGRFYGRPGKDYPNAPGRMIALKTDPIWIAINRFGVPWKPFDWGSGMGTRNIRRSEAVALGLIEEDDPPQKPRNLPFNQNAQASLAGIAPDRRRAIEDALCGDVEIDGDTIRILPPQESAGSFAIATPNPALAGTAARARSAAQTLSASDAERVMQPIRNTVAYRRLAASAKAAGTTLDDTETIHRAVMQFFAMTSGLAAAIREMRLESDRDSFWSEMDFTDVFSILESLLGGAS